MDTLEVPRGLAIRVRSLDSGIEVTSGRNILILGLLTPLGAPFLLLAMTVFGHFLPETAAMLLGLALHLFLITRQERLLLGRDGKLRWTRYWSSTVDLTGQQVEATVLKNGRLYLGGDRGLYWPVGADSMTWLEQALGSWAEGPEALEVVKPARPTTASGAKSWEVALFGLALVSFMGLPYMFIMWDGAEPAETDFWHHVLLLACVAAILSPSLAATMKYFLFRAAGDAKPFKSFFRVGTLLNGLSLGVGLGTLAMGAFTYNIHDDPTAEGLTIPVVSSFHLTGTGGNGYPQDIYALEFDFPPYIQREPVACFSGRLPTAKHGDVIYGGSGKGRLGCRWYRLPEWVQHHMVNPGEVYQSGLESQSFGHLSLRNAMLQGKVQAQGHFAPRSSSLALLRSYKVPIREGDPHPGK